GTFKPTTAIQRSEVATIVTRMADKSQRKTFTLEKAPVAVTEVQLAGKTQITVGETTTWTAKALPAEAQTTITWAAGNPGVATVDANGNIKGIKAGQCNITATAANGVKKTVLLTVSEVAVTGITLAGKTNIAIGGSTTWTATVSPANATNKKLTWTAGNPGVATVDQNGNIKGIKAGQCNITVSAANGVKKTVMVTVAQGGTLQNPYDGNDGALVEYRWTCHDPVCLMRIKVKNIYYGSDAERMMGSSYFNSNSKFRATASQEWRVYEYDVEYVDCKSAISSDMNWNTLKRDIPIPAASNFKPNIGQLLGVNYRYYTTSGASVPAYEDYGIIPVYGSTYVSLFKGASSKVYYGILVDKGIGDLLLGVERVRDATVDDKDYTFIRLNAPAYSTTQASAQHVQNTAFDALVTYAKAHSGTFATESGTEPSGISSVPSTSQYSIRYDTAKDEIILSGVKDVKNESRPRKISFEMTIPRNNSGTFNGKVDATETNTKDSSKTVNATGTIKIKADKFPFNGGYGYDVSYNSYSGESVSAQLAALSNESTAQALVASAQWCYQEMLVSLNRTVLKPAGFSTNDFGFSLSL
ncbi:MAG: Ig domain-containing protein, partial [Oscillospiraceae bacterium]|nr:Ig domain-containing protein [Oscillospiraceae bacterium]